MSQGDWGSTLLSYSGISNARIRIPIRYTFTMFDDIIGNIGAKFGLGDKAGPLVQMVIAKLQAKFQEGGVQGMLEMFQGKGLGDLFGSWVGGGPNKAMSAEQVDHALGEDFVQDASTKLDMSPDDVRTATAEILPEAVNKMTPGGKVGDDFGGLLEQAKGMLGGGDMLKGLSGLFGS